MKRMPLWIIRGQRTPYRVYFTSMGRECQGRIVSYDGLFVYIITGYPSTFLRFRLTRKNCRDKITGQPEYAGMVDSVDLGDVTSVKVFPSRCHCEPDRLSGVAICSLRAGLPVFIKCGSSNVLHLGCLPV